MVRSYPGVQSRHIYIQVTYTTEYILEPDSVSQSYSNSYEHMLYIEVQTEEISIVR